ncbi:helix-hairpin-helix domain-containing protein [Azospirillum brasilense]|uniref:Helix-hairpin-helix domain-containing protein n=1 Tax=Azospirillum brasilense TaxID=192 RepID=A0A0P0F7B9_AZOBR|nr:MULTISPECIES: helix-hairpin-helix domain-containing protein [Azospirillum]ALJ35092.1 DNA-binding protein [Azospirillum brasilense]MDW7553589.1 helix-hairpin-helix domain-containing protein [Azospirillum brasilense]MDW7594205.1 helix-hairpin-helix domain-containing protein [Azospirillum brasilense]MDW7629077.1 helix-hairpin-helix domain-containing protein [Azospirillum brasilense]MDX5953780.1 helix-hairpin-helix domain-containing protein [Azospirillum brasilense]
MKPIRLCAIAAIASVGAMIAVPALAQSTAPSATPSTTPMPQAKPAMPPGHSGTTTAPPMGSGSSSTTAKAKVIDLNTAGKEELQTLPGIGEARSEAIVKNRPYRSKDELVSKKIVPQNVYDDIKGRIAAVGGSKTSASAATAPKK